MSSAAATGSASSGIRGIELSCAARVEKKLNAMSDVLATGNFATEKATVTAPASIPVEQLIDEIEQAGYGAEARVLARPNPEQVMSCPG
jgi:Cu+-exporting ATPase